MEDKDYIKDLFKNHLDGLEAEVRPDLWNAISSQLPAVNAAATTGLSVAVKSAIIAASAAVIGLTVYVFTPSQEDNQVNSTVRNGQQNKTQNGSETSQSQQPTQKQTFKVDTESDVYTSNDVMQEGLIEPTYIETHTSINAENTDKPIENSPIHEISIPEKKENINRVEPSTASEVPQVQSQDIIQSTKEEKTYTLGNPINVFTPNGDGANDYFEIPSSGLEELTVVVLDSQNKTIYISSDPMFKWDGTLSSGDPVQPGNYMYFLTARDQKGNPVTQSSYLRIVR